MKTSYFGKWWGSKDPRLVSIARYSPGWYQGRKYLTLAPFPEMLKLEPDDFWREYETILKNLDPRQVLEDVGNDAILLCWEGPGKPCHRHRVAEWLEENLGFEVPEIGGAHLQGGLFR